MNGKKIKSHQFCPILGRVNDTILSFHLLFYFSQEKEVLLFGKFKAHTFFLIVKRTNRKTNKQSKMMKIFDKYKTGDMRKKEDYLFIEFLMDLT